MVLVIQNHNVVILAPFMAYILISMFTVLNVPIGVLCEVVSATVQSEEEHKMIKGMVAAMRSAFFTLVLLALFLYVFAIVFAMFYGCPRGPPCGSPPKLYDYFGTMGYAMTIRSQGREEVMAAATAAAAAGRSQRRRGSERYGTPRACWRGGVRFGAPLSLRWPVVHGYHLHPQSAPWCTVTTEGRRGRDSFFQSCRRIFCDPRRERFVRGEGISRAALVCL